MTSDGGALRSLTALDRALGGRSYGVAREHVRTILPASEHETIELPSDVLGAGGRLDVYEDVFKLFQVRFKNGRPVLQLDRYVGYIPLNDRYAIDVTPRVPVGNLERLIGLAAGYRPLVLENHLRAFTHTAERPATMLDIIARHLVTSFERVWSQGLLSDYERQDRVGTSPSGKIHPLRSALRSHRTGMPVSVSSAFHRTKDIGQNRVIRAAFERLLRQFIALPQPEVHATRRLELRRALARLEGIGRPGAAEMSTGSLARYLERLPQHRDQYADVLILSQIVLGDLGLSIRGRGALTVLPTVLIDMEKVFEEYVRVVLSDRLSAWSAGDVRDGNKDGANGAKRVMFADRPAGQSNSNVTPDIVVFKDGNPRLVIDAKYKAPKGMPDRPDLNQVVTYGARYGCSKVMLLYASRKPEAPYTSLLGDVGGIAVYVGRLDLGAEPIDVEETAFAASVAELLPV